MGTVSLIASVTAVAVREEGGDEKRKKRRHHSEH